MQNKYFLKLQKEELSSKSLMVNRFIYYIRYIDIDKLKKLPEFDRVKQSAISQLSLSDLFNNIAIHCVRSNNLKAIQFLIEECSFTNLVTYCDKNDKITLFHEACMYGVKDIIIYLLKKGADINAVDADGCSALHRVVQIPQHSTLISLLKNSNANLNIRNSIGLTPLHAAALYQNEAAIKELRKCGANMKLKHNDNYYVQILEQVRNGNIEVLSKPPTLLGETQETLKGKLYANFYAGFLLTKCNQQIFQDFSAGLLMAEKAINTDDSLILMDAYFLGSPSNPSTIIKFLTKNLRNQKLTPIVVAQMIFRISNFLVEENEPNYAEALSEFVLDLLQKETKTNEVCSFLNEVVVIANNIGLFDKAERVARLTLSMLPENIDKKTKSFLFYNLAMSLKSKLHLKAAKEYLKNSFELINDDSQIFGAYLFGLLRDREYSEALQICKLTRCSSAAEIATAHVRYILGELSINDLLQKLADEYHDQYSQHYMLNLKSYCYQKMGEYTKAAEYSRVFFSSYTMNQPGVKELKDIGYAIMLHLKTLLECDRYEEALQFLITCKQNYPLEFSSNLNLKGFSAIVYLVNKQAHAAESIIKELQLTQFSREYLSQLYTNFAISEFGSEQAHSPHIISYLDIAIKIDPNNQLPKLYKILISILEKNKTGYTSAQSEFDEDFLKNVAVENNLLTHEPSEKELEIDDYDPIKVHRYFQQQKKQLLFLSNQLLDAPESKAQWLVNKIHYQEENMNLVALDSKFYPKYFAVIHPHLNLDPTTLKRFQIALAKGLCKRKLEQNGIKFLNGKVIELKIDEDIRLCTSTIYKNSEDQYLIIFDTITDHKLIQAMLRSKKSIEVIEVSPSRKSENKRNDYPGQFFEASAENSISDAELEKNFSNNGKDEYVITHKSA